MAVTERGGGPATASGTGAVSVTLTGTQQPQTGDWLVIVHGNDFYALSNMSTPTVGGSTSGVAEITGTGLPVDGGSNFAHVRCYKKPITSGGSDLTVALVETGAADEDKMIAVHVLVGASAADCIDVAAGAFDSSGSTNLRVCPSVTATTAGFALFHTNNGGGAATGPYTWPGGTTEQYDGTTAGMSFSGASEQLAGPGVTGTRTATSGGNAAYGAVSLVVAPADAAPAPSVPPLQLPPLLLQLLAAREQERWLGTAPTQAASGSGEASARTSTTSSGVKGAAGAALPTARTTTTDSGVKKATGAGVPTARSSTTDAGLKQVTGTGLPSARTTTTDAGVKKATGTGTPSARTATAATSGAPAPTGSGTASARTSTTSSGVKGAAGAALPSARTSVTDTGVKKAVGTGLSSARTAATQAGLKKAAGLGLPSARSSTVDTGVKKATGTGRPSARTTTASSGGAPVSNPSWSYVMEQSPTGWDEAPDVTWTIEQALPVWRISQA